LGRAGTGGGWGLGGLSINSIAVASAINLIAVLLLVLLCNDAMFSLNIRPNFFVRVP
jgi:hypothetical protein